ncbi:hypothetical protein JB92DRAFT_2833330 [Gautieria morchelliformis]|nr:hypothetical protein JB92DRAFT_2833330 [Gautieria morchelliformis]
MTDLLDDSDSIGTTLVCKGRRSSLREALLFACVAFGASECCSISVLRLSSHTTHSASLCASPFPQLLRSVLTTRIPLDTVCGSPAPEPPHAPRPAPHGARVCDPCRAAREADLCLSVRGPEQDRTGREDPPRAGLLLRGSYTSTDASSSCTTRSSRAEFSLIVAYVSISSDFPVEFVDQGQRVEGVSGGSLWLRVSDESAGDNLLQQTSFSAKIKPPSSNGTGSIAVLAYRSKPQGTNFELLLVVLRSTTHKTMAEKHTENLIIEMFFAISNSFVCASATRHCTEVSPESLEPNIKALISMMNHEVDLLCLIAAQLAEISIAVLHLLVFSENPVLAPGDQRKAWPATANANHDYAAY